MGESVWRVGRIAAYREMLRCSVNAAASCNGKEGCILSPDVFSLFTHITLRER